MRKLFMTLMPPIAALGLAAGALPALAADAPYGDGTVYVEQAPFAMEAATDWSGFYAGFNLGYGFGNEDPTDITAFPGAPGATFGGISPEGWVGGVQAGYNTQMGNLVLGLEGDLQLGDITGTSSGTVSGVTATGTTDLDWYGSIRPRLGFTTGPALIYATGGLAFGGLESTIAATGPGGEYASLVTDDDVAFGYVVGGGIEYALNDAVSIKAEYQYAHLGAEARGTVYDAGGTSLGVEGSSQVNTDLHIAKVGLNFRF